MRQDVALPTENRVSLFKDINIVSLIINQETLKCIKAARNYHEFDYFSIVQAKSTPFV